MHKRIMIVAGEASGDAHAALLVRAMRERAPALSFYGVGGDKMRAAGVETRVDAHDLSIMGFTEAALGLRRVWGHYKKLSADFISANPPDMVILVDFPEFNLVMAKAAKKAGIPVFYYVSPQVWAWRQGRVRKIADRVTRMVVLFPFERDLYGEFGLDVHFVGHPLAEDVRADRGRAETLALHGLPDDRRLVTLLPGSRAKELEANFPVMLEAAARLRGEAAFAVARAPGLAPGLVERYVARVPQANVAIVDADTYNLVSASDAVAVTSGTATVECALIGVPMVVLYRMSRTTYLLAKLLVKSPFIAMPNIVLGREVVPELVQSEANADNVVVQIQRLLDPVIGSQVKAGLTAMRDMIVLPGAAGRAAELALEVVA